AGDYQVRYLTDNGCSSAFSAATTVTVNDGVEQPNIFTNSPICDGETLELTATSFINATSYQWFGPEGGNPTLNTALPRASVTSFSNAYLSGTWRVQVTSGNGCISEMSEPIDIEILANPAAPTAEVVAPSCAGSDVQLQASTVGNATFQWTGPNGFSSNFQNPIIRSATTNESGTYQVQTIVNGCASPMANVAVSIATPPTAAPTNNGGACGEPLRFFANSADGSGNYSYQWAGPNNFITSADDPVIDNPSMNNEGVYSLMVTDETTGCTSEIATTQVTVITDATFQPNITGNNLICAGERLTLSTLEITNNNVTYEWTGPNGTSTSNGDYPDAPNLIINDVQATNAGDYQVSVTVEGCASTPADIFTVGVNAQPEIAPSSSLTSSLCTDGTQDVTLFTNPTENGMVNFEWIGPNDFTSVAENPTITAATSINSGIYTVVATNTNGCVSERMEVSVLIRDQPTTPIITPVASTICAGEEIMLSVPIYDGSINYNWALNGNPVGDNTNSIVIESTTTNDAGVYSISIDNNGCSSTAASVNISISESPVVTLLDQDAGCATGSSDVAIQATVMGGDAPYTYEWTGANGFTSTDATPIIPNAASNDAGTYNLVVTDANGCVAERQSAVLTINDQPQQPIFASAGTTCTGEPLELMVQAYSGTNVTYNWTLDGVALNNNSNILFVNPASTNDAGEYAVTVMLGTCASQTTTLDVAISNGVSVAVDNQDVPCTSGTASLNLTATVTGGNAPYTYQWVGPNGFSSSMANPTINNVSSINSGSYTLQVSDNQGCTAPASSGVITITDALDEPLIIREGGECAGEAVTLRVKEYDGNNIIYNWTRDGIALNNDNPILNINPTTNTDEGNYQVTVTVDGCSINSDLFDLILREQPQVNVANVAPVTCTDGTQDITLAATPADPNGTYTYQWTGPNNFSSTNQNATITNADASKAGTYILVMTDASGCPSAEMSVVVDVTDALTQPVITATNAACVGEALSLMAPTYEGASVTYTWFAAGNQLASSSNELLLDPVTEADDLEYTVVVNVNGCENTSSTFRPIIHPTPTVEIADVPAQACTDGRTDLILDASPEAAADPMIFNWTGPNGFTASGEDVLLTNVDAENNGNYTVVLTDGNGCTSAPASVAVSVTNALDQPVITSLGNVCVGGRTVLSVPAYSGINVNYDWRLDNTPLNVNSNQLIFENAEITDRGTYSLNINIDGCTTSADDIFLDVYLSPSVEILPLANDLSECTSNTDDIILNAEATGGTGAYRYEWTGPTGFNSTLEDPTIFNVNNSKSGTYEVAVVDTRNCASEPATIDIDITDAPSTPVIVSSGPTCLGGRIVLSSQVYEGSNTTYQWTRDGIVLNNNSNVLVIDPVQTDDDGMYVLSVTQSGCETGSAPFEMEFYTPPTIEVPDFPDFACIDGQSGLTLSATARGGSGTYRYSWEGPNGFISNQRLPELDPLTAANAGTYRVFAEDSNGCPSEVAELQLNITERVRLPQLLTSGPACIGGEVLFEIDEYDTDSEVTYEWFKNDEPLPFSTRSFMLSNVSEEDAGTYQIRVTIDGCDAVSPKYILDIYESPEINLTTVTNEISCVRGTESFTFDLDIAGGRPPYIYRWSGPNDFRSTLQNPTLSNLEASMSGTYTVFVRDQNQCITNEVSVEVAIQEAPEQPIITTSGQACAGEEVILMAQNYSGGTVEYQWTLGGNRINNNSNILNINAVSNSDVGEYELTVIVDDCPSATEVFNLEIYDNLQISITTPPSFSCSSGTESHTFEAVVTGGEAPYTYQWNGVNNFTSNLPNPTISNLTENFSGTYTLVVSDANGCMANAVSTELVVTNGLA
ncbi:MAG: hypothetical protein AB8G22_11900, partial [Saprospiraceae bacterium]